MLTADAPGFVVNRLLAKVMGEAARAVYEGTPLLTVEKAFAPLGLPMTPFQLIDLVGWKVAAHVQDTMAHAFPDRFLLIRQNPAYCAKNSFLRIWFN